MVTSGKVRVKQGGFLERYSSTNEILTIKVTVEKILEKINQYVCSFYDLKTHMIEVFTNG